jgi:hypothetical protein
MLRIGQEVWCYIGQGPKGTANVVRARVLSIGTHRVTVELSNEGTTHKFRKRNIMERIYV